MIVNIYFNIQYVHEAETSNDSSSNVSLNEVLSQQLKNVRYSRAGSTMNNYTTAISRLNTFLDKDISIDQLDANLLCGFERWLQKRGVCMNTISCYMRSLRALLSAYDKRFCDAFSKVYTGKARTEKRSVPTEVIVQLKKLQLPSGTFLELARDVFVFSFYAMGMPFVDVAHLLQSQLTGNVLVYCRQKTGQRIQVTIEPPMEEIIDRHRSKTKADFLFPLLHEDTEHEYQILLGRYNRALHRLASMAGINVKLTSYVVRHTWASTAYKANIDLPVISKALGHTNPQTTLTYIREIDDQRLAQANRSIIELIRQ